MEGLPIRDEWSIRCLPIFSGEYPHILTPPINPDEFLSLGVSHLYYEVKEDHRERIFDGGPVREEQLIGLYAATTPINEPHQRRYVALGNCESCYSVGPCGLQCQSCLRNATEQEEKAKKSREKVKNPIPVAHYVKLLMKCTVETDEEPEEGKKPKQLVPVEPLSLCRVLGTQLEDDFIKQAFMCKQLEYYFFRRNEIEVESDDNEVVDENEDQDEEKKAEKLRQQIAQQRKKEYGVNDDDLVDTEDSDDDVKDKDDDKKENNVAELITYDEEPKPARKWNDLEDEECRYINYYMRELTKLEKQKIKKKKDRAEAEAKARADAEKAEKRERKRKRNK